MAQHLRADLGEQRVKMWLLVIK